MYEYIKEPEYPYYPSGDRGVDAISVELTRRGVPNYVENTGGHVMVGHIYSVTAPLVICFDDMGGEMYDITTDDGWSEPLNADHGLRFPEGVCTGYGWGDEIDPDRLNSFVDTLMVMLPLLDVKASRIATNAETVTVGDDGFWRDTLNRTGYYAHFGGAWICYTCGHLCECGESDE